jgi:hypothetical protein
MLAQRDPDDIERQLLQTTVPLTLAAGVGDLAPWVTAHPSYLTKTIDLGAIFHPDSNYPLQQLDSGMFKFPWPAFYIYFDISGNTILTLNTDGSQTSLTGDLTITLLAVPTLANLPLQLEPLLIEAMVAETISGQTKPKARKA